MTSRREPRRRDFLRLAGAGSVAIAAGATYALHRAALGEPFPPDLGTARLRQPRRLPRLSPTPSPILLLEGESPSNPFAAFLAEILCAEGLRCFDRARLSAVTSRTLERHDIALLAEAPLDATQAEMLEEFVHRGGRLVCMRPDPRLARMLGVERLAGEFADGYLVAAPDHPVADGLARGPLQFHGGADKYRLSGARAVAWLSTGAGAQLDHPAVAVHDFGEGRAALWAFDLARSVAYTRQGNPAWVGRERDGLEGLRAVDLLAGWIDLDRAAIPQADEQQRLLAALLTALASGARPLPRVWYFPAQAQGMLIATGDSHMSPAAAVGEILTLVERRGGHMSVYYTPQAVGDWRRAARRASFLVRDRLPAAGTLLPNRPASPTPGTIAHWRARGHEFTLHPWVDDSLVEGWRRGWREFTGRGYGPVASTVRTHRALWSGWVETARQQCACGIGMSLDAYQVGPSLRDRAGRWVTGHLTGSGLPMKYVDERGQVLDIYQQNTQLTDEQLLAMDVPGWGGWSGLTPGQAVDASRAVLRRAVEPGGSSAIAIQCHVDAFHLGGDPAARARAWLEGTLDAAADLGLPIWSAQDWLRFTALRHDASFEDIRWDPSEKRVTLRLDVTPGEGPDLTVLLPLRHGACRLTGVSVDGATVPFGEQRVGGVLYASTSVSTRTHEFTATYR